jgi:hypothetical protein
MRMLQNEINCEPSSSIRRVNLFFSSTKITFSRKALFEEINYFVNNNNREREFQVVFPSGVTSCSLVSGYWRFGEPCCFCLEDWKCASL